MFCCGVCNAVFTGAYSERVFTTSCGHLFHFECLETCFNKASNGKVEDRCPFCSLRVDTSKLIKIHFQIGANWKDTAAALKNQANTSIINLDESLISTSIINESCMVLESDRKTMLTTSLSGVILTEVMDNFLSMFNHVIKNSTIQERSLMSEKKLIDTAREAGYSDLIIIIMNLGHPIGLYFIDLIRKLRLNVTITSYKCFNDNNLMNSNDTYFVTKDKQHLNELQEFILYFFSKPGDVKTALFLYSDNCNNMKFTHSVGNLTISFIIKLPQNSNNHESIKAIN